MCICDDDTLCLLAEAWWTTLNQCHEDPATYGTVGSEPYRKVRADFMQHRTTVLREKGVIAYNATTGYQFYPDWRERLLPTWKKPKEE